MVYGAPFYYKLTMIHSTASGVCRTSIYMMVPVSGGSIMIFAAMNRRKNPPRVQRSRERVGLSIADPGSGLIGICVGGHALIVGTDKRRI